MSQQNINVGTGEGLGDGESLRTAFQKIQNNFSELYSRGGYVGSAGNFGFVGSVGQNAANATTDFGTITTPSAYKLQVRRGSQAQVFGFVPEPGELIFTTDTNRLYVGNGVLPGGVFINGLRGYTGSTPGASGNWIPAANNTYDLGSTSSQWRHLYLSSSSLYINGIPITIDANNKLLVDGAIVSGDTGGLTFDDVKIQGTGTGLVLGSLELVPNPSLYASGQYVHIRPTVALDQSHIHMIAGDPDQADLYLGDDDRFVKIDHTGPVEVSASTAELIGTFTAVNTVIEDSYIALETTSYPWVANLTFGDRVEITTGSFVTINVISTATPDYHTVYFVGGAVVSYNSGNQIKFYYKIRKNWKFNTDGSLTFPDGTAQSTAGGGGGGYIGSDGYVGSQGIEGYVGSQGELGYTGSQGGLGYTGSQGIEGYVGSQGELGYVGSQGELGYVGSEGYVGSQGELGYVGSAGRDGVSSTSTLINNGFTLSIESTGTVRLPYSNIIRDNSEAALAFGYDIGFQGSGAIAIGFQANQLGFQQYDTIAIGVQAGQSNQAYRSIAIGFWAGKLNQGTFGIGIGNSAGRENQKTNAVAIGASAGRLTQGEGCVAVGFGAQLNTSSNQAIAIGNGAGRNYQGTASIAIGYFAGSESQPQSSTIINATGQPMNVSTGSSFYVKPMMNITASTSTMRSAGWREVWYNPDSGQFCYRS